MDSVWPERKRCRGCRRFFGPLVIAGKFCSYHCAGKDAPSIDPMDWPRGHYVPVVRDGWGKRQEKRPYNSEAEALAGNTQPANAYMCGYCWMWHRATAR